MPRKSDLEIRGIIPCVYKGQTLASVKDISEAFGCTIAIIHMLTKDKSITTIDELYSRVASGTNATSPGRVKKLFPSVWVNPKTNERVIFNLQKDVEGYFGASRITISSYCGRDEVTSINDLCKLLLENQKKQKVRNRRGALGINSVKDYPCEVAGVTYSSDQDVANMLGVSKDTVRRLRYRGFSTEEILSRSFRDKAVSIKDEFPCVIQGVDYTYDSFCKEFESEYDPRVIQKRYKYFVTDRNYSMEEFYNALKGIYVSSKGQSPIPKESRIKQRGIKVSESCFWLRNKLFLPSLHEACSRFGVPAHRVNKKSDNIELAFIKSWVKTRIKDYDGWVTEILKIEDFVFESEGISYYRCYIKGNKDIKYLSEEELMDRRLSYVRVSHNTMNEYNGVYNSQKEACAFYGLSLASYHFKNSDNPANSLLRSCSSLNAFRDKDGKLIKGNRFTYNLTAKKWKDVIEGNLSLEEAQSKLKDYRDPVWVEEPVFDGYDVIRYKKKRFDNKISACKYYKLCKVVSETGSKAVSARINEELFERQQRKVFINGEELATIGALCRNLGLDVSKVKWISKKYGRKELGKYLLTQYYKRNTLRDKDKTVTPTITILDYSFTDSKSEEDYFTCKIQETGYSRIKVLCSRNLIMSKLNDYIDKNYEAQEENAI